MTESAGPILHLTGETPFAVGGRRLCFVHPLNPARCVKVLRQDEGRTVRSKRKQKSIFFRFRRSHDNNEEEFVELGQLARQVGPPLREHVPACHGYEETDLGPGLVLDLIRDHDGRISRSLRELVSTGHELSQFRSAFDELGAFFVDHSILTRALLDHNLTLQDRGEDHPGGRWRMFLIDGFGDPAWIPLARWIPGLAKIKIRKRLREAWPRFEKLVDTPVSPQAIAKSTWGQGFLQHRGEEHHSG